MPHRIIISIGMFSLLLSFFGQLADIAEASGSETIAFAESMHDALPCAFEGVDLQECGEMDAPKERLDELEDLLNVTQQELRSRGIRVPRADPVARG